MSNRVPRFYFHTFGSVVALDTEGTELPGQTEACLEALRLAGSVLLDDADRLCSGGTWRMDVTNQAGSIVYCLDLRLTTY